MNYILLEEQLDLPAGTIMVPSTNPELYQAAGNEAIAIPKSTMDALPLIFQAEAAFTWDDKGLGIEQALVNAVTWSPEVGDYFSTYNNELDLWKIIDDPATDFTIVKITGNLTGIGENPTNVAQAGFTTGRFQVFTPAVTGSPS